MDQGSQEFVQARYDEELTTQTYQTTNVVKANLEQWADAVEGRAEYRFSRDQVLHNVEILEAIVRSADSGEEVTVRQAS